MYSEGSIRNYLEDAASGRPTPGGGSVSALVGALGASMACMAANFTVGKEKYRAVEAECRQILGRCEQAWKSLLKLTDADTLAYAEVSKAYSLPKDTSEQKAARSEAIQKSCYTAMEVPLAALRTCASLAADLERLAEIANPNLISDVGVAAIHVYAALRGCKLNVEINLASIKNRDFAARQQAEIDAADVRTREITERVMEKVGKAIRT